MVTALVEWGSSAVERLIGGEEEDDASILKDPNLIAIYEQPFKQLGLSSSKASPWEVRDAFRLNCLQLLAKTYFNKMDKPKLTYKYALVAWHLCAKTFPEVRRAVDLKKLLDECPGYFRGNERDVLPILRPVSQGGDTNPATRACGWLTCIFVEARLSGADGEKDYVAPHQNYVIRVVYCGRQHVITKRYSDFQDLNRQLTLEVLMVPGFPEKSFWFKVGFGDWRGRGEALCAYANRVHASLAARGVYSPRLLKFLGVDVSRVHIEEDGRISRILDSTGAQQGSVWHVVEEGWLKRWRKFVLGRAARRYEPPGPITNELLLVPRFLGKKQQQTSDLLVKGKASEASSSSQTTTQHETTTAKDDNGAASEESRGEKQATKVDLGLSETRASTVPLPKRRLQRQFPATLREIKALAARENRHVFVPGPDSSLKIGDDDDDDNGEGALVLSSAASTASTAWTPTPTTLSPTTTHLREPLTIGKHYRAVNYNLWVYWKMVHGGGPCISRKQKDITSAPACGTNAEARSRLQRFGRVCVAKNRRLARYWQHLSKTAPGVREVLLEYEEKRLKKRAEEAISASKSERTKSRLRDAARYTQRTWRAKKQYAFNDDNVRVQKHAQEVFATADGEVEHAAPGAPFVVEEGEAVVKLGNAERYDVKFTDADGPTLPVTLKKHSCSELTFIQVVDKRFKRDPSVKEDSVLLVVQNYPVSSLTHLQAMSRLTSARWPVSLRFERPLEEKDVVPFREIVDVHLAHQSDERRERDDLARLQAEYRDIDVDDDNARKDKTADVKRQEDQNDQHARQRDDFKLQLMKRLLHMGVPLRKFGRKGKPHETKLYLNETLVFWEIKHAQAKKDEAKHLSLKYDLTKGLHLYELKYVRVGKVSPVFNARLNKSADPDRSFTIFADGRTLDFEVPYVDASLDDTTCQVGRRLLAWAFDKIIKEARGSKIFVDKTGAPIRRTAQKKRLRMVR
eukprot:CAMPEP_0118917576 /NCGR_PEP_ID=MMETSP1166-20130328/17404_1 /TAXON_ID=1104430 /ORGANISM="Chrysoreinhardia sp, Strain CCMP3193" /LENGTH=968 /DNA_ID=CAMNT_0006857767 /DNA_START=53 /DNA_END=2959 /DNA_ORIENTATION=+